MKGLTSVMSASSGIKLPPPIITLERDISFDGADIRVHEMRPEGFIRVGDYLTPEFTSGSHQRKGKILCYFDRDGQFIGLTNIKTVAGATMVGAWRKNLWYEGEDRHLVLRMLCGGNAHLGNQVVHAHTLAQNYAVLKIWKLLGLGARKLDDGRWKTCGLSYPSMEALERGIAATRSDYRAIRAAVEKRKANVADRRSEFIPVEPDKTPEFTFSCRFPSLDDPG